MNTPSFDFSGAGEGVTHPAVPSQGDPEVAEFKSRPAPPTYRAALIEQIVRDSRVLKEDAQYHVPSREFYERRIASYKETLRHEAI